MIKDEKDHIYCRICLKKYRFITKAHLKKHGISKQDYIKMGYPVCSEGFREITTEISRKHIDINRESKIGNSNGVGPHNFTKLENMKGNPKALIEYNKNKSEYEKERDKEYRAYNWSKKSKEEKRSIYLKSVNNRKIKKHTINYLGKDIILNSLLELNFVKILIKNNIKFFYEHDGFEYYDNNNNRHFYFPDFYLPDCNTYVEVKPTSFLDDEIVKKKMRAVLRKCYNFCFMTEVNIQELSDNSKTLDDFNLK